MRNDMSSAFDKPEFKQTLRQYEEMIRENRKAYFESEELTLLAEYYAGRNDVFNSEKVIEYGLELHPDNLDLLVFKGRNLILSGKLKEAEWLIASLPDSSDYEVQLMKAELLLAKGESEEAQTLLEGLFQENPETDVMLDIAQVYMDAQELHTAARWLKKAYREKPDSPDVLEMLASYYFSSGDMEKAASLYNRILDENPYNLDLWQNLIKCYIRTMNMEKAMEAMDFAMAIDDRDLTNWELKSHCMFINGQTEEGFRCLKHIEEEAADKTYIQSLILMHHFMLQDFPQVLEYCDLLLQTPSLRKEEIADLYHKRALANLHLQRMEECRKDLETGFSYDACHSGLYLAQGEYFLQQLRLEDAQLAFQKALQYAYYSEGETLEIIGIAYLRSNYILEALDSFLELERQFPEIMQRNYYFMAYCYFLLQQPQETFTYLVRGTVYCPEVLDENERVFVEQTMPDPEFFTLANDIARQIQSGELDPSPYLPKESGK